MIYVGLVGYLVCNGVTGKTLIKTECGLKALKDVIFLLLAGRSIVRTVLTHWIDLDTAVWRGPKSD